MPHSFVTVRRADEQVQHAIAIDVSRTHGAVAEAFAAPPRVHDPAEDTKRHEVHGDDAESAYKTVRQATDDHVGGLRALAELSGGPANREAVAAFMEKREPDFSKL